MIKKIKKIIHFKKEYEFLKRENERLYYKVSKLYDLLEKAEQKAKNELYNNLCKLTQKDREISTIQSKLNKYKKVEELKKQKYTHKVIFKEVNSFPMYNTRYISEKQFNEIKQVLTTVKDDELYIDVAGELFKIKDIEIISKIKAE